MLPPEMGGPQGLDHPASLQDGFTACFTTTVSPLNSLSVALVAVEAVHPLCMYYFIVVMHLNRKHRTDFLPCIIRNQLLETSRKRLTCDQGPILHCAGQSSRLQGLLPSGRSLLQYLVWTDRFVLSCRGWIHRTDRTWYPVFPQLLLQGSHSPVTHLG